MHGQNHIKEEIDFHTSYL